MATDNKIVQQQIDESVALLQSVLEENLLGVYVYGSLLVGGLHKYSDIDLFAVTSRETTRQEKEQLEKGLLKISGIYAISEELKPIELIIVVQSKVSPWQYPPSFDFLYGDWVIKGRRIKRKVAAAAAAANRKARQFLLIARSAKNPAKIGMA